jgi:hypothetical protein
MNDGRNYAERWIRAWNSMDLGRALALWADDMEFCSPLAAQVTGSAVLAGKSAAADYWGKALQQAGHLNFELVEALWDPEARTVTIVYRRERGTDFRIAAEVIRLNEHGLGVRGTAFHGAALPLTRAAKSKAGP